MNSYQQPQPGKAPRRFFTWVRSSGLIRGNERWIGGVCSGIAQRLGLSPTLVRALMIVATLFFGFGAALYAMGWFLIPDVRSGQILAEDLIEGQWDWNCLGCFLFMAVAVLIPGAGWVCIALAALVLWLIAQSGVRQQEGYGFGYTVVSPPRRRIFRTDRIIRITLRRTPLCDRLQRCLHMFHNLFHSRFHMFHSLFRRRGSGRIIPQAALRRRR